MMVPFDFEAYPLAYLVLERRGEPRTRKMAIKYFLESIKKFSINPSTFLSDKDEGQLKAILETFPSSSVQLCLWHTLQAINRKMKSVSHSDGEYRRYFLDSPTFPWISPDFPLPIDDLDPRRIMSTIPKSTRHALLDLVRIHFNRHPLIPNDQTQGFLNQDEIHS